MSILNTTAPACAITGNEQEHTILLTFDDMGDASGGTITFQWAWSTKLCQFFQRRYHYYLQSLEFMTSDFSNNTYAVYCQPESTSIFSEGKFLYLTPSTNETHIIDPPIYLGKPDIDSPSAQPIYVRFDHNQNGFPYWARISFIGRLYRELEPISRVQIL